jgi:hypothetical protein
MNTLLVPSDGSPNSIRAVSHAVGMVKERVSPTEIELLHVLDPVTFTSLGLTLKDDGWQRARPAEVDRVLADAEKIVREADVPYRVCWRVGDPVDEIAAEAKEKPIDGIGPGYPRPGRDRQPAAWFRDQPGGLSRRRAGHPRQIETPRNNRRRRRSAVPSGAPRRRS